MEMRIWQLIYADIDHASSEKLLMNYALLKYDMIEDSFI